VAIGVASAALSCALSWITKEKRISTAKQAAETASDPFAPQPPASQSKAMREFWDDTPPVARIVFVLALLAAVAMVIASIVISVSASNPLKNTPDSLQAISQMIFAGSLVQFALMEAFTAFSLWFILVQRRAVTRLAEATPPDFLAELNRGRVKPLTVTEFADAYLGERGEKQAKSLRAAMIPGVAMSLMVVVLGIWMFRVIGPLELDPSSPSSIVSVGVWVMVILVIFTTIEFGHIGIRRHRLVSSRLAQLTHRAPIG
jgi:hypothetical protein